MHEPSSTVPSRRVWRVTMLGSTGLAAAIIGARVTGLLAHPKDMTPLTAIAFSASVSLVLIAASVWYLNRTDEHDRNANLWSMAWGWISAVVAGVSWAILSAANLVTDPNLMAILLFSSLVVLAIYSWMRFR